MKTRILALLAGVTWSASAVAQINIGGNPIRLPNGKTIGMGNATKDTKKLMEERKAGFRATMSRAEGNFEKKQWDMARQGIDAAKHLLTDKPDVERLVDLMQKMETEGVRQLKGTQKLKESEEYRKYLRELRRISFQFGTLPCGKRAKEMLALAASDPGMQAALQEVKATALEQLVDRVIEGHFRAQARSAKTKHPAAGKSPGETQAAGPTTMPAGRAERIKRMDLKKQARVVEMLQQIAKLYPHSPTGVRARSDLETLLSDKAFMARLAAAESGREVRRAYSKAETYRKAGLIDKAVLLYKRLIKKYPGTPEANRAADQIRELGVQAASS